MAPPETGAKTTSILRHDGAECVQRTSCIALAGCLDTCLQSVEQYGFMHQLCAQLFCVIATDS